MHCRERITWIAPIIALWLATPARCEAADAGGRKAGPAEAVEAVEKDKKGEKGEKKDMTPPLKADAATLAALKKIGWEQVAGTWELQPKTLNRFKVQDGTLTHESSNGQTGVLVYGDKSKVNLLFRAGVLQCAPYYQDWSTEGLVHVIGREVVPSSVYTLASVDDFCMGNEDTCMVISPGLQVSTTRWADIEIPFSPPSPTVQPDLADVSALVDKFRSASNAPIKVRAAIYGEVPDLSLDLGFDHISACVDAFRGLPYPFSIEACP